MFNIFDIPSLRKFALPEELITKYKCMVWVQKVLSTYFFFKSQKFDNTKNKSLQKFLLIFK